MEMGTGRLSQVLPEGQERDVGKISDGRYAESFQCGLGRFTNPPQRSDG